MKGDRIRLHDPIASRNEIDVHLTLRDGIRLFPRIHIGCHRDKGRNYLPFRSLTQTQLPFDASIQVTGHIGKAFIHRTFLISKERVYCCLMTDRVVDIVQEFVGEHDILIRQCHLRQHLITDRVLFQSLKHHIHAYHPRLLCLDILQCLSQIPTVIEVRHIHDSDDITHLLVVFIRILQDLTVHIRHLKLLDSLRNRSHKRDVIGYQREGRHQHKCQYSNDNMSNECFHFSFICFQSFTNAADGMTVGVCILLLIITDCRLTCLVT